MQKTVVDVFNQTMIAPGHNNYSGLQYTELIKVGAEYLLPMNDVGRYRDGAEDLVDGEGVAKPDGFDSFIWGTPGITFAEWNYFRTSILGGKRSGKVTARTRKYINEQNDNVPDIWVVVNAVLTLPPLPDSNQGGFGLPEFDLIFTRVEILHEDAMIGELKLTGGSTAQAGITTTPEKLTGFDTAGINDKGVTVSASDDSLTAVVAADYQLFAELNFTATASTQWTFQFYVDGVAVGHKSIVSTNATPDPVHVVMLKPYRITATDVVTIYVNSDAGGGASLTLTEANFYISS
jgi:hypothetical protein